MSIFSESDFKKASEQAKYSSPFRVLERVGDTVEGELVGTYEAQGNYGPQLVLVFNNSEEGEFRISFSGIARKQSSLDNTFI